MVPQLVKMNVLLLQLVFPVPTQQRSQSTKKSDVSILGFGRRVSSAAMRVTLLRHAESLANAAPAPSCVHLRDCGCTPAGISQARALPPRHWDVVVVSPLARTRATLAHAPFTWDRLVVFAELREIVSLPSDVLADDAELPPDGAPLESAAALTARLTALSAVVSEHAAGSGDASVLIVGHADLFFAWTAQRGADGELFGNWLDNAELFELDAVPCSIVEARLTDADVSDIVGAPAFQRVESCVHCSVTAPPDI